MAVAALGEKTSCIETDPFHSFPHIEAARSMGAKRSENRDIIIKMCIKGRWLAGHEIVVFSNVFCRFFLFVSFIWASSPFTCRRRWTCWS